MIARAIERRAETFNPLHPKDPGLATLFNFRDSSSGISVTDDVALTYSAVFSCVKVLAETLASIPLPVFRRLPNGGRERDPRHPLFPVLHHRANPEMTSAEFRETLMLQLCLRGNGLANIVRNGAGDVVELWPLRTDRVRMVRRNGKIFYLVQLQTETRTLRREEVFHVRSLSPNGLWGYSPIDQGKEAIGLGLAAEKSGASFYANDSTPSGILKHKGELSPEARQRLKETWDDAHQGFEQKHRVAVLEDDLTWESIGVTPEDAQFLGTRTFQVLEIARWFRIPPHLIQEMSKATFSNIDSQSLEFVKYTMLPWFFKWEQAIQRDLILEAESESHFAEFLVDGLLRGDPKLRAEFYRTMWGIGAMNDDEIRARENLNPQPDGKGSIYYVPLNFMPAGGSTPPAPTDAGGRQEKRTEQRQQMAEGRRRLSIAFEPAFRDAAVRMLRVERRDVMKEARRQLGARDVPNFMGFLDEFYEKHQEFVSRTFAPALDSFAELVAQDAAENVSGDVDPARLQGFVAGYLAILAKRHASSSREQLKTLVEENVTDPLPALEKRFDEWDEQRADRIAKRETVQASGAVTKHIFAAAGVVRLVWVTFGKNCPFCDSLSGKVVGIEESFAQKGEMFEAEGRDPLRIRTNISHPPIHLGCDCSIVPG